MARRPEWIFDGTEIEDTHGYGARAVDFLKRLKHPKSRRPNGAYELPFFWERIVRRIYGPCLPNGNRQVRTVFVLLPRGARKTTMGAGLALLHTFGWERVPGGQAMVAAGDEEQASIAFEEAVGIAEETPWLDKASDPVVSERILKHPKSKAWFKAISSKGKTKLGKTPSFVLADELIAWENRELWQALRTGLNKVSNTLLVVITQAGRGQENLAFNLLQYARKVHSGEVIDPSFLPVLFETEEGDDWEDEAHWHFVNPGLAEGFPDLEGLRTYARECRERPAEKDDFCQFHLNHWLDYSQSPFVSMPVYDEGKSAIDLETLEASQAPCWLGVDLSSTNDLTAVVACWGDRETGYQVKPWFFLPRDNIHRKAARDGVDYVLWEQQGHITLTEGNVIDFHQVEAQIKEICARFNVREIAFDPALARNSINNLMDEGLPVIEFRQGWLSMSPAINELERSILARRFAHGGNPILRWHFDNVSIRTDTAGNRTFHKGKSRDRIDGAVATAMAVARAAAGDTGKSSYDDADMDDVENWAWA